MLAQPILAALGRTHGVSALRAGAGAGGARFAEPSRARQTGARLVHAYLFENHHGRRMLDLVAAWGHTLPARLHCMVRQQEWVAAKGMA
jgi:hypothetical protein